MKRIFATAFALTAATACSTANTGESEMNAVRNEKNQHNVLTVLSLAPVFDKQKQPDIVASCGYELDLRISDDTLVHPLNKFAYDNRFNDFASKSKGLGGIFVVYSGVLLGDLIGGAAVSTGIFPPAGLLLGGLVMVGSAIGGGGLMYHAGEDMVKNKSADEAFVRVAAGNKSMVNQYAYEDLKKSITEAANSKRPCPAMKLSNLKKLSEL
ncbi:MAG: hypothetical protein RIR26_274 [Pseudomonadota bacterium]|jgi:hypothetical protein